MSYYQPFQSSMMNQVVANDPTMNGAADENSINFFNFGNINPTSNNSVLETTPQPFYDNGTVYYIQPTDQQQMFGHQSPTVFPMGTAPYTGNMIGNLNGQQFGVVGVGKPIRGQGLVQHNVVRKRSSNTFGDWKSRHKNSFDRKISSDSDYGSSCSRKSSASSRKTSSNSMMSSFDGSFDGLEIHDGSTQLEDVAEEEPYVEPTDEVSKSIVEQVEFYFADDNITKDKFLLKHVRRNNDGFVSLKLVTSFKKVKQFTKDWRQTAEAIEKFSSKLKLNDERTKVRRLDALPDHDEMAPSRTVAACNIPLEKITIETVAELFKECGEILLVRIQRPDSRIPSDIRPFANKHPEMIEKVCAFVEYEKTEFALKAIETMNGKEGVSTEAECMIVVEMVPPPPKTTKKHSTEKAVRKSSSGFFNHQGHEEHGRQSYQHDTWRSRISNNQSNNSGGVVGRKTSVFQRKTSGYFFSSPHGRKISNSGSNERIENSGIMFMNASEAMEAAAAHTAAAKAAEKAALNLKQLNLSQRHVGVQKRSLPNTVSGVRSKASHPRQVLFHSQSWNEELSTSPSSVNSSRSLNNLPKNVVRLPRGPVEGSRGFQNWCDRRKKSSVVVTDKKRAHAIAIVDPSTEVGDETKETVIDEKVVNDVDASKISCDNVIEKVIDDVVGKCLEAKIVGEGVSDEAKSR